MKPVRSSEPIHVLHVDDDPAFTRLAATSLVEINDSLEVSSENDPIAALERLSDEEVDCVVSDYQMPGLDGLALLERVREEHASLPFILLTGQGSERVASEAILAGVTGYVSKDGGLEQFELLADRIRRAVEQRRAERLLTGTPISYERLVESAPDAIFVVDAETGRLLETNGAAEELVGKSREELRGLHQTELHPAEERERYERIFAEHVENADASVIHDDRELYVVHDDGHAVPVEISAAPVTLDGRRVVQAIFRNLTGRL